MTHYWKTEVELWPPAGTDNRNYPRVLSHDPMSSSLCVEHPHVHPSFECGVHDSECNVPTEQYKKAPRYAFMSLSNCVGLATAPCGWARVDLERKAGDGDAEYAAHLLTTRQFSEGVVLVPKDDNQESVGPTGCESARVWVLGMFYDAAAKRSAVAVVDGETMERRATLWLRHVSPHGLHGSWAKA